MTILSIAQDVADDAGFSRPATLFSTSNRTSRRLLAAIKAEVEYLIDRHDWVGIVVEATLTTTTATQYAMSTVAPGFYRLVHDTGWDRTNQLEMRGPITPQRWQLFKSGIADAGTRKRWRITTIQGLKYLELEETPTAGESLVFEYVTERAYISNATSQLIKTPINDADTFALPENLIKAGTLWRFLKRVGMDFEEELSSWGTKIENAMATDGGTNRSRSLNGQSNQDLALTANIQDANFPSP